MEALKDKEKISKIFQQVLDAFGLPILNETQRLNAVLMDYMPHYEKERKFLIEAVKLGAAQELLSVRGKSAAEISSVTVRCKAFMESELLVKESVADYTIELLASALRIRPSMVYITIPEEKAEKGGPQKFNIRYGGNTYRYSVDIPAGVQDGTEIDIVRTLPGRCESGTMRIHIDVKKGRPAGGGTADTEARNVAFIYHRLFISEAAARKGGRQEFTIDADGEEQRYFVNLPAGIQSGTAIDIKRTSSDGTNMGTIRVCVMIKKES